MDEKKNAENCERCAGGTVKPFGKPCDHSAPATTLSELFAFLLAHIVSGKMPSGRTIEFLHIAHNEVGALRQMIDDLQVGDNAPVGINLRNVDGETYYNAADVQAALHAAWPYVKDVPEVAKLFDAVPAIPGGATVGSLLPARDPSKPAEQQGQFRKFEVRRVDGSDAPGGKHEGCHNFVLDLTHDPHAIPAIRAYAAACTSTHPQLAAELDAKYGTGHDNLRDRIGQAIADEIASGAVDTDWLDAREVDRLAGAALAVQVDVKELVQRFLGWRLPDDFSPDCGISFLRDSTYEHPEFGRTKFKPVGTNLFNADQAKAMFEHALGIGE